MPMHEHAVQGARPLANIVARHGFGISLDESGSVTVAFMYNKFEPYVLQPVNIEDLYRRHLEQRPLRPFRPSMRQFPEDRAEYLDKLQEDAANSWEGMKDRAEEAAEKRREGINDCYQAAEESWKPKFESPDYLEQIAEMEEKLRLRRRALPGWQEEPNARDLSTQARRKK